jgi:hypothetical protein
MAGNHTIAGHLLFLHPKVYGLTLGQFVNFHKTARIEKQVQAFSGCQFASFVLTVDRLLTTADFGLLLKSRQSFQFTLMCFGFRHGRLSFIDF